MSAAASLPAELEHWPRLRELLTRWVEQRWLRRLDAAFAEFLAREAPGASPLLLFAAALASHQLARGHACLDLAATLADPEFALALPPEGAERTARTTPAALLAGVALEQWLAALADERLLRDGAGKTPLVLAGTRLYLRRYWQYEQDVGAAIERRLAATAELADALPHAALRAALDALFPPSPAGGSAAADAGSAPDWQKIAGALAARSRFSIITGGPGTGKTTTVVRLLALLQALALAGTTHEAPARALRIRLAAPTGKAAARLSEAIAGALATLPLDDLPHAAAVRAAIPVSVGTLHRLLGSRPESRSFRHHAGNPLPVDLLVIDEASMVDLELMAAVFAALPAHARLFLLGDKDQLASVEAGSILGELCQRAAGGHYTPQTCAWVAQASGERIPAELLDAAGKPLDQAIVMLRRNRRFAATSGIGQLSEAVNSGDAARVRALCQRQHSDLALLALTPGSALEFTELVIDGGAPAAQRHGYRDYLTIARQCRPAPGAAGEEVDDWARRVLDARNRFQVLCALRRGAWGVDGLNQRIARALAATGLIAASDGWYCGRPVLVTRNDYPLGLMNGDLGVALELPASGGGESALRVAFLRGDAARSIRWLQPSRLHAVETAYALTVHKSQGSEFGHTALILPEQPNPILTRELLYTGSSRARAFLTLVVPGSSDIVAQAVQRQVLRASGLSACA